jgi:uncharacterized protein YuzE
LKFRFDEVTHSLYVKFNNNRVVESEELEDNLIVDFDNNDKIVGFEILNLQKLEDFEFPISIVDITKDKLILGKG